MGTKNKFHIILFLKSHFLKIYIILIKVSMRRDRHHTHTHALLCIKNKEDDIANVHITLRNKCNKNWGETELL